MPANPKHHLHRRRLDRLHEEHRRRRAAAPGAGRRDDRADGHQPAAARGKRRRRQQAGRDARASRRRSRPIADQRAALDGADFVVVAFQIGGYEPCTVTDFEVPKKFGLRQTIADTLGIGGIMRGIRTVPHLWTICEDMLAGLPRRHHAAIRQPDGDQHLGDRGEISRRSARSASAIRCRARRRNWPTTSTCRSSEIRYRCRRHQPHGLLPEFRGHRQPDGSYRDLYPDLVRGYREGRAPKPGWNPRCPNKVRYEMLTRLGYFVTESSEHFAEYTPWFIKRDRPDLIEKFGIPLDEYPKRCVEQIERWKRPGGRATGPPTRIEVEREPRIRLRRS